MAEMTVTWTHGDFNPRPDDGVCKRGEMVGDGCYCDCEYDVKICPYIKIGEKQK